MKQAIVIGATSGIGCELARILSQNGYLVGIAGRRTHLLEKLQSELPGQSFSKKLDISKSDQAIIGLKGLIDEMESVDLIVISSGIGSVESDLPWEKEKETIDVNVSGFVAMANVAYHYFLEKESGHLVGISSIAAIRGGEAPAYNASKAFVSSYLQGLRYRISKTKLPITITDIQPGFVDTAMAKSDKAFWVASAQKSASQIYAAICNKRKHAYITKRWRIIAWLFKLVPDFIYHKL